MEGEWAEVEWLKRKKERKRTFQIIARLVRPFSPQPHLSLPQHKDDHPSPQYHHQPIPPRRQPSHIFTELEFGNSEGKTGVPEDDLVWRIERRGRTTDEEEEVGAVERENQLERWVREVCHSLKGISWRVRERERECSPLLLTTSNGFER
jgi:hypothetical protein